MQLSKNYFAFFICTVFSMFTLQFSSCYYDNEQDLYGTDVTTCDTTNATYSLKVATIIDNKCLNCHSNANYDNLGGGTPLEGYDNIAQYAGDNLLGTIEHSSGCSAMPKGSGKIPDCEITIIKMWIDAGYPNN